MLHFSVFILACVATIWASPQFLPKPIPVKNIGGRIVNGEEAKDGQFPWQVAILGRSPTIGGFLCGGSIIDAEWILTAGHCVDGATAATIYAGSAAYSSPNRTTVQAASFILHEDYDPTTYNNDIGLIKLRTPLRFDKNIQAIAVADEELKGGTDVTISGWGQISDSDIDISEILQYIVVSTIDNLECAIYYGAQIVDDGKVCTATGSPLKSPCLGDSGGPIVVNADTDPVLAAVFSFVNGYGCEFPYPAGNTRTAYYRDWIKRNTGV